MKNHECFYVGCIDDAFEILKEHYTYEEVKEATGAGAGCCRGARCKGNIEKLIDENK